MIFFILSWLELPSIEQRNANNDEREAKSKEKSLQI